MAFLFSWFQVEWKSGGISTHCLVYWSLACACFSSLHLCAWNKCDLEMIRWTKKIALEIFLAKKIGIIFFQFSWFVMGSDYSTLIIHWIFLLLFQQKIRFHVIFKHSASVFERQMEDFFFSINTWKSNYYCHLPGHNFFAHNCLYTYEDLNLLSRLLTITMFQVVCSAVFFRIWTCIEALGKIVVLL